MYRPGMMEHLMTQQEFAELKQRVCAAARGYTFMSKFIFVPISLLVTFGIVIRFFVPNFLQGIGFALSILGVVIILLLKQRVVAANNAADGAVRAVLQEFNNCMGGRCILTLYTVNTGICKSKHSAILRHIYVAGAAQMVPMPMPMPMAMTQQGSVQAAYPNQYGYGGGGPPVIMGEPAIGQIQPAGTYEPGYAYPAAAAPVPTHAGHPPSAGYYPSTPAAALPPFVAIHREVFYATVPEGVSQGEEFAARTPAGRAVTLTAPTGARGGMDFQVSA
jgi:hypothetical protein